MTVALLVKERLDNQTAWRSVTSSAPAGGWATASDFGTRNALRERPYQTQSSARGVRGNAKALVGHGEFQKATARGAELSARMPTASVAWRTSGRQRSPSSSNAGTSSRHKS